MISTYDELRVAIRRWLAKSNLDDVIPDFIRMCESHINRRLRVRQMETRAVAFTTESDFIALPDLFGGIRYIKVVSVKPEQALVFYSPEQLNSIEATNDTGLPKIFTIIGAAFRLIPRPDTQYTLEISYYKLLEPLADDNQTNWLLEQYPDVYLWGALKEAEPFLKNDDRIPIWEAKFANALEEIETADGHDRWGTTLTPTTQTGTP